MNLGAGNRVAAADQDVRQAGCERPAAQPVAVWSRACTGHSGAHLPCDQHVGARDN